MRGAKQFGAATKLLGALVVAGLALTGPLAGAGHASHSDPRPNTTFSWYMNTTSETVLYDMGCAHGNRIAADNDPRNPLTILDFGKPVKIGADYGADLPGVAGTRTLTEIRKGAQAFFQGMFTCLPSGMRSSVSAKVSIGVNNDFPVPWVNTDANDFGHDYAVMVNNANGFLSDTGMNAAGNFNAGVDFELAWSSPGMARAMTNGYKSGPGGFFVFNFGDAQGCQWFGTGDEHSCGSAAFPQWDSEDVHYVSYGSGQSKAYPEIYREDGVTAEEWVLVSKWGIDHGFAAMDVTGPLTQHRACHSDPGRLSVCNAGNTDNTSAEGWDDMVNKMDARPSTIDDMLYSSDIDWH